MTTTTTKTPRKASLTERRALWKSQYRKSEQTYGDSLTARDTAVVNMFRSLPDSVTTVRKTATGETKTTKPVSDNQRAKDTLAALAVGVDDKGTTRDRFALTPVRVTQIVKAYHRAEAITMASTSNGSLAPALETEAAGALVSALTTAGRGNYLGDKGADALAETLRESLADTKPGDVVAAAEVAVRDAIAKAADAKKADKETAKPKAADAPRPVVVISNAIDSLEAALVESAKDLDPQQKALLGGRLEALVLHLK